MSAQAVEWRGRLRGVRWPAWVLLALAAIVAIAGLVPVFAPLGALYAAGPLLFAAAVFHVAPADRRFGWAALALASLPVAIVAARWIADAWARFAGAELSSALPFVITAGDLAVDVARVAGLVGLILLGLALGGVRGPMSALIIAGGVALALLSLTWLTAQQLALMPVYELVRGAAFSTLSPILWAFVFAAAVESLRSVMIVGTGLMVANIATGPILLWWAPGPGTNTDLLTIVIGGVSVLAWLFIAASPLRGELDRRPDDAGSSRRRARARGR